jgi:hydroxymethylbilane synthase
LRCLGGGCQVPIGTYGRIETNVLKLDAMVGSLDGTRVVRGTVAGRPEEAEHLGVLLARQLLSKGADRILESIRSSSV